MPRSTPKPRVVFHHHSSFVLRVSCTPDKRLWRIVLHDLKTGEHLEFASLGALFDYFAAQHQAAQIEVLLEGNIPQGK